MERVKLTNEELTKVLLVVASFNKANQKLEELSSRLEQIENEKAEITQRLNELKDNVEELRRKEKSITESLVNKYGPFSLDMETFEIITT
jgi:predicted transcriptional regulator